MNVERGMQGQRSVRACAAEMGAKQEQEQERAQRTNIKRVEFPVESGSRNVRRNGPALARPQRERPP
jgi:uncharacterized protein YjaZ